LLKKLAGKTRIQSKKEVVGKERGGEKIGVGKGKNEPGRTNDGERAGGKRKAELEKKTSLHKPATPSEEKDGEMGKERCWKQRKMSQVKMS